MTILVTGGAGYIGSHTCVELIQAGFEVVVLDNLSNSSPLSLQRVEQITGKSITFYQGDIRSTEGLSAIFKAHAIDAVVHFAGLKAVGESVVEPLRYYENNVGGTINLCKVMDAFDCRKLVFSSSATVYGDPVSVPIREDFPLSATNPYGRSKLMVEECLRDLFKSNSQWHIALLRYFNPVGAHPSGLIGEDPNGIPNNLMPYIAQVAIGRRDYLNIFGNDYPTPDGTGIRDYIHVVDLAKGHVKAIQALSSPQVLAVNLGTGVGYSVLDILSAFERASNRRINYKIAPRRAGDIACCFSDPSLALKRLGWQAEYDIEAMCADTWRWQISNPSGY